jgi:hypothetical protein
MKALNPDGSTLMEVSDVRIDQGRILVIGKIMGAMPMKAVIPPREIRMLIRQLGFRRALHLGWLVVWGKWR